MVDLYDKRQWDRYTLISPLLSALHPLSLSSSSSSTTTTTTTSLKSKSRRSDYYGLLMGICALVREDINMKQEEVEFVLNEVTMVLTDECRNCELL